MAKVNKYVFKPYSEIFPTLFEAEKLRIAASLGVSTVIEHIGSTAVPGLGGKGIIDIALAVAAEHFEAVSEQLQRIGYEFRPAFSTPDRWYFIIDLPDLEEPHRRYHVHVTSPENNEWKDFIEVRDYLRNHPQARQEYAEMKKQAAREANHEGALYRQLKEPMFKKIKLWNTKGPPHSSKSE